MLSLTAMGHKVDPAGLPGTVVCYTDSTIALPIITSYLMEAVGPSEPKRLYARMDETMAMLVKEAKV